MKRRKQRQISSVSDSITKEENTSDPTDAKSIHQFSDAEVCDLREFLLSWYDKKKRDLPWRKISTENVNQKAYAVWVSEIMLQQTQVATVIDYYNKWMKKWPTVEALAASNIEEINEAWSGLGYYSRGRRLFEGAVMLVKEMSGQIPTTAAELERKLPGVGRYTAAAIASIAFGEITGLVDGNVIRVLTRLRSIGANINQQDVIEKIWSLANQIVDPEQPGDFNQALMELGAVVCSPKTPSCGHCPVKKLCQAYTAVEMDRKRSAKQVCIKQEENNQIPDIECLVPNCNLCFPLDQPWDRELGVQNFPRKPKKSAVKQMHLNVLIVSVKGLDEKHKFLICQRPKKGLLAGLWEFPTSEGGNSAKEVTTQFCAKFVIQEELLKGLQFMGEVTHMFSHVHHHYKVWQGSTASEIDLNLEDTVPIKWLTEDEFNEAAVSTGMRKVFKVYKNNQPQSKMSKERKRKSNDEDLQIVSKKSQPAISDYFKRK